MLKLSKALIVDGSVVFRDVLALLLKPYSDAILTAGESCQAIEALDENPDIEVVFLGTVTKAGNDFRVLEHVASLDEAGPLVIFLTAHPSGQASRRATELGATACLTKPIMFGDIARVLKKQSVPCAQRRRTLGHAVVVDPQIDDSNYYQLAYSIRNVSVSGAFLETKSPIPVGTNLHFELLFGYKKIPIQAEVVRVQAPSWDLVGGVGVAFKDVPLHTQKELQEYIDVTEDESLNLSRFNE